MTSPPPASPAVPRPPRYAGIAGAVRYALTLTGVGLAFGGFAGGLLWLGTRDFEGSLKLGGRVALVCAAAGVAAALARLICGGESDRLLTVHFVKGEVAGVLGFIAALVLVGYFTEPPPPAAGRRVVAQAVGRGVQAPPVNPLQWWFAGVMRAPWWLLLGMCVGAAGAFALAEAGLRRAFRRPTPPGGGAADVSPAGPPTPAP